MKITLKIYLDNKSIKNITATNLSRKNIIKIPILISGQLRQHKLVNIIIIEIKLDIGNTIIS